MARLAKIKLLAAASLMLCLIAFVLSLLCILSGSNGFMEDYAIVTLNTSRIVENAKDKIEQKLCSDSLKRRSALDDRSGKTARTITSAPPQATADANKGIISELSSELSSDLRHGTSVVGSDISAATSAFGSEATRLCTDIIDKVGDVAEDLLQDIGIQDWYSAHVLDLCEGYYVPGPVPNGTCDNCIKPGTIHKNVTHCTNMTAIQHFDPKRILAEELKKHTDGLIDLSDLEWPSDITRGLRDLKLAQKTTFVFYCLACGFIGLAMLLAGVGIFSLGRLTAIGNLCVDILAFLTILIASSIVTYIAIRATHLINKYGNDFGISATRGNRFLAITWSATGLVFLSLCIWIVDIFVSRRDTRHTTSEKQKSAR